MFFYFLARRHKLSELKSHLINATLEIEAIPQYLVGMLKQSVDKTEGPVI
jgi:hypothetical protein